MESLSEVTCDDFAAALTPARVRWLQLFCALPIALVLFAWVGVALAHLTGGVEERPKEGLLIVQAATALHALNFFVNAPIWFFFTGRWLSPDYLAKAAHRSIKRLDKSRASEPADKCVALIEKMVFLRFLALGSAAGVGVCVVCFAAVMVALPEHPILWLNGITTIPFLVWAAGNFPLAERLKEIFRARIAAPGAPIA